MSFIHFDEAKVAAAAIVRPWLDAMSSVERVLLIFDLFGKLRVALWRDDPADEAVLSTALAEGCGPWWTGELLSVSQADKMTQSIYNNLWTQARHDPDLPRLAVADRHRTRAAWFADAHGPLWEAPANGPPIVVFYSFKGGLGRSTLLSSFAIQCARAGERVCILDFDLESPGVGTLLSADPDGLTARWGVVDYLLERAHPGTSLGDYYHRCDRVAAAGEIVVFPVGKLDGTYAEKLARADMDETSTTADGGLFSILGRVRHELKPSWILLDARTGISEPAGQLLSGIAHLHVLLGTTQDQSWQGINIILDRLGKDYILANRPQAEVIIVQAMVPPGEAGKQARYAFAGRAEREFTNRYYAEADDARDDDRFWDTSDMDNSDAPHVPVPVDYDARLASFSDIAEAADALCAEPYATAAQRIMNRFEKES